MRHILKIHRSLNDLLPTAKHEYTIRTFNPAEDKDLWLALNNKIFTNHPDQGNWALADLENRMTENWFDAEGFFLAVKGNEIVGFVWTKIHQDLINQLNTFILDDSDREIAEFLVGSIDDMGYIRRTVLDIVDDMAFTQGIYTDEKTIEKILHVVQELEPAGVGARDLQECLLLQLKHKTPSDSIDLAIEIINGEKKVLLF